MFSFICFYIQKFYTEHGKKCVSKLCIHKVHTEIFAHRHAKTFIKKRSRTNPSMQDFSPTQMLNLQKLQEASYRDAFLTQNWLHTNIFGVETFF